MRVTVDDTRRFCGIVYIRAWSWWLSGIHSFMAFLATTSSLYKVGFGFGIVCTKSPCLKVSLISRSQPWRFYSVCNNFEAPDVAQLAAKARISLTPKEVEDYGPKIGQVIDWFGQLQGVNLENVEPAIRSDTDKLTNLRPDEPIIYEDREEMIAAVPMLEEPFIKVPKILKNNIE